MSLNNAGTLQAPINSIASFGASDGAGGWDTQDHFPREVGDVNGDGRADIVGFGYNGVYLSLASGGGNFAAPSLVLQQFGTSDNAGGWSSQDHYPRLLADVNADGRQDIVAFGENGVYVALSTGTGFTAPVLKLASFGAGNNAGGWSSETSFPRELADVNGDGYTDIVGFGDRGVYVALNDQAGGFQAPVLDVHKFGSSNDAGGWISQDLYPRLLGDVTGDGRADIVGFGAHGVFTSQSLDYHLV